MRDDVDFNFGFLMGFFVGLAFGVLVGATAITMGNNSIKNTQIEQKCSIESDDYIILNNEIYYKK